MAKQIKTQLEFDWIFCNNFFTSSFSKGINWYSLYAPSRLRLALGANILLAISEIKDVKNQRPAKLYEICRVATLEINKKLTKNKHK